MKKQISRLNMGETFVYHGYYYKATNERKEAPSQRYCKKLAFLMDGVWHPTTNAGDWFNIYCDVDLATMTVVSSEDPHDGAYIVVWEQRHQSDKNWTVCKAHYMKLEEATKFYKMMADPDNFGPIHYRSVFLTKVMSAE